MLSSKIEIPIEWLACVSSRIPQRYLEWKPAVNATAIAARHALAARRHLVIKKALVEKVQVATQRARDARERKARLEAVKSARIENFIRREVQATHRRHLLLTSVSARARDDATRALAIAAATKDKRESTLAQMRAYWHGQQERAAAALASKNALIAAKRHEATKRRAIRVRSAAAAKEASRWRNVVACGRAFGRRAAFVDSVSLRAHCHNERAAQIAAQVTAYRNETLPCERRRTMHTRLQNAHVNRLTVLQAKALQLSLSPPSTPKVVLAHASLSKISFLGPEGGAGRILRRATGPTHATTQGVPAVLEFTVHRPPGTYAVLPPTHLLSRLLYQPRMLGKTSQFRHAQADGRRAALRTLRVAKACLFGTVRVARAGARVAAAAEARAAQCAMQQKRAALLAAEHQRAVAGRARYWGLWLVKRAAATRSMRRIEMLHRVMEAEERRQGANDRRDRLLSILQAGRYERAAKQAAESRAAVLNAVRTLAAAYKATRGNEATRRRAEHLSNLVAKAKHSAGQRGGAIHGTACCAIEDKKQQLACDPRRAKPPSALLPLTEDPTDDSISPPVRAFVATVVARAVTTAADRAAREVSALAQFVQSVVTDAVASAVACEAAAAAAVDDAIAGAVAMVAKDRAFDEKPIIGFAQPVAVDCSTKVMEPQAPLPTLTASESVRDHIGSMHGMLATISSLKDEVAAQIQSADLAVQQKALDARIRLQRESIALDASKHGRAAWARLATASAVAEAQKYRAKKEASWRRLVKGALATEASKEANASAAEWRRLAGIVHAKVDAQAKTSISKRTTPSMSVRADAGAFAGGQVASAEDMGLSQLEVAKARAADARTTAQLASIRARQAQAELDALLHIDVDHHSGMQTPDYGYMTDEVDETTDDDDGMIDAFELEVTGHAMRIHHVLMSPAAFVSLAVEPFVDETDEELMNENLFNVATEDGDAEQAPSVPVTEPCSRLEAVLSHVADGKLLDASEMSTLHDAVIESASAVLPSTGDWLEDMLEGMPMAAAEARQVDEAMALSIGANEGTSTDQEGDTQLATEPNALPLPIAVDEAGWVDDMVDAMSLDELERHVTASSMGDDSDGDEWQYVSGSDESVVMVPNRLG